LGVVVIVHYYAHFYVPKFSHKMALRKRIRRILAASLLTLWCSAFVAHHYITGAISIPSLSIVQPPSIQYLALHSLLKSEASREQYLYAGLNFVPLPLLAGTKQVIFSASFYLYL
jgi:hypothetical protein